MKDHKMLARLIFGVLLVSNAVWADMRDAATIQSRDDFGSLFQRIQDRPLQIPSRRKMAATYLDLGYRGLSQFYGLTADYLEGKSISLPRRGEKSLWLCRESVEEARKFLAVSSRIDLLIRKSDYRTALEEAQRAIRSNGSCCMTMVEWSRVVLASASDNVLEPSQHGKEREELAVRWLLTGAEEINVYAFNLEGKPTTYSFLADYFLSKKDYVSAYVSTFLAIEHLHSGDVSLIDESRLSEKLSFLKTALQK